MCWCARNDPLTFSEEINVSSLRRKVRRNTCLDNPNGGLRCGKPVQTTRHLRLCIILSMGLNGLNHGRIEQHIVTAGVKHKEQEEQGGQLSPGITLKIQQALFPDGCSQRVDSLREGDKEQGHGDSQKAVCASEPFPDIAANIHAVQEIRAENT
jgi:hypothetical protein